LEAATRARIEDRTAEAAQLHLVRAAMQARQLPAQPKSTPDAFSWLRQLATRLIGAGA
jgi:hypothetical protein